MSTLEDRTLMVLAYIAANAVAGTRYAYIENRDVPDLAEALRVYLDAALIPLDLESSAEFLGEVELDIALLLESGDPKRPNGLRLAVAEAVAAEITRTKCAFIDHDGIPALATAIRMFLEAKDIRVFPRAAAEHFNRET